MRVNRHAETSLVALGSRLPVPASTIIKQLRDMPEPTCSVAIEVARLHIAIGRSDASNGDVVLVIVRDGVAVTAMLRRSWNQPLTPAALRVDEIRGLTESPAVV